MKLIMFEEKSFIIYIYVCVFNFTYLVFVIFASKVRFFFNHEFMIYKYLLEFLVSNVR